jgi:hypothetical protein
VLDSRRHYHRFSLELATEIITSENKVKPIILKDLSARGAGSFSNYPLELNEKLTLVLKPSIFFPSPIRKFAKVIWCKKIEANFWQGGLDFGEDKKINLEQLFSWYNL